MSKFFQAIQRTEGERLFHQRRAEAVKLREAELDVVSEPSEIPLSEARQERAHHPLGRKVVKKKVDRFDRVEPHLVSLTSPTTFEAEQYRLLGHMIEQAHVAAQLVVTVVSSPSPGDGKTTTAVNLASALAQTPEARVLLVDGDLRRPSIERFLGLPGGDNPGLIGAVHDATIGLDKVVRIYPPSNLAVLPAGRPSGNLHEILRAPRLVELINEARRQYDYIIVDTPPLIPFPDCRLMDHWVDGYLIVIAAHKTPRKLINEAVNTVDETKLLGLVFNSDDRPVFGYYSYYGYDSVANRNRGGWLSALSGKMRGLFQRKPLT